MFGPLIRLGLGRCAVGKNSCSPVGLRATLFVMGPHADHFYHMFSFKHLIHKSMLYVNTTGVSPIQVTDQLLIWRWLLKRIFSENVQQFLGLWTQVGSRKFFGIFPCLPGKNKTPRHHSTSSKHSSMGVSSPSMIDSLMPGMLSR